MKKALFGLLLMANFAYAGNEAFEPNALFDISKSPKLEANVKINVVKDVNAVCNAERRKFGQPVFNYSVDACSFERNGVCHIVVPAKTTMYIIGHELRHCFQGAFH